MFPASPLPASLLRYTHRAQEFALASTVLAGLNSAEQQPQLSPVPGQMVKTEFILFCPKRDVSSVFSLYHSLWVGEEF